MRLPPFPHVRVRAIGHKMHRAGPLLVRRDDHFVVVILGGTLVGTGDRDFDNLSTAASPDGADLLAGSFYDLLFDHTKK